MKMANYRDASSCLQVCAFSLTLVLSSLPADLSAAGKKNIRFQRISLILTACAIVSRKSLGSTGFRTTIESLTFCPPEVVPLAAERFDGFLR